MIKNTPNVTHRSAYNHNAGKVTVVRYAVVYYIKENYKLILKFGTNILSFKASAKILK